MDRYVKLKQIGQGAFGKAFLVVEKPIHDGGQLPPRAPKVVTSSSEQLVLKEILANSRADCENALKEAQLLQAMDHPNIVRFKESFVVARTMPGHAQAAPVMNVFGRPNGEAMVVCIVTEFVEGGDLRHQLERQQARAAPIPEETVWRWFIQLCLALKHVHDRKVLHRDLKPENIFLHKPTSGERGHSNLNEWVLKLGDFGIAKVLNSTLEFAQTMAGTPYYFSPEIWLGSKYNNKTDVWSLGCIVYELITLRRPFDGSNQRQLCQNITQGSFAPISSKWYSAAMIDLVNSMLAKNPRQRPSVDAILRRPCVVQQMQGIFSQSLLQKEMDHTVLHGVPFREHLQNRKSPQQPKQLRQQQQHQQHPSKPIQERKEPISQQAGAAVILIPTLAEPAHAASPVMVPSKASAPALAIRKRRARFQPTPAKQPLKEPHTRDVRVAQPIPRPAPNVCKDKVKQKPAQPAVHVQQAQPKPKQASGVRRVQHELLQINRQKPLRLDRQEIAQAPRKDVAQLQHRKAQIDVNTLADRVAAFNEQWQEQKQNILQNLQVAVVPGEGVRTPAPASPAPGHTEAFSSSSSTPRQTASADAEPSSKCSPNDDAGAPRIKDQQIQPQVSRRPSSSPACSSPSKDAAALPATRDEKQQQKQKLRQDFRNELRLKRQAAKRHPMACPLDDPIILVQNIPGLPTSTDNKSVENASHPDPAIAVTTELDNAEPIVVVPEQILLHGMNELHATMPPTTCVANHTHADVETSDNITVQADTPSRPREPPSIEDPVVDAKDEEDEAAELSNDIIESLPSDNEFERMLCHLQVVLESSERSRANDDTDTDTDEEQEKLDQAKADVRGDQTPHERNQALLQVTQVAQVSPPATTDHSNYTTPTQIHPLSMLPPPLQQDDPPLSTQVEPRLIAATNALLPYALLETPVFKQALYEWLHEPKDQLLGQQISIFARYDFSSDQWDALLWLKQYIQEVLAMPSTQKIS